MLPCQARPSLVSAHPLPSRATEYEQPPSSSHHHALSLRPARAPRQHALLVHVEEIHAMRFSRRSPFLSLATGIVLLALAVSAADKSSTDTPNIGALPGPQTSSNAKTNPPTTPNGKSTTAPASNTDPPQSTSSPGTTQPPPTTASSPSTTGSTPSQTVPTITGPSSSTTTDTATVPSITGPSDTSTDTATDFPTLAGAYVKPSVPPTANAPFMKQSKLPEGTVFIIVGAILGFLAMSVILWRGLVVWSLHRSIKRAAIQQNVSTAKSTFQTPPAPFYAFKDRESALSVGGMGPKSGRRSTRPSTASGIANQSLFFSPTAGANGLGNPANRGSGYLPAGYYAAGASQLGNGQGMAHVGSGNAGISLSNLGPSRDGYAKTRSVGPSPPGSPYINAIPSSSTLNLSQAPGEHQRAPSAYLDDLFDSEASPPVPNHRRNPSGAARGSPRF
jgi:hypothetical protein